MRRQAFLLMTIVGLLVALLAPRSVAVHADDSAPKRAAEGTLQPPVIHAGSVTRTGPTLSGGIVGAAADEIRQEEADSASGNGDVALSGPASGSPGSLGCSRRDQANGDHGNGNSDQGNGGGDQGNNPGDHGKSNVRVNQDCTFRRQAEEDITYNRAVPTNLTAGQNDSRVGFNQCGIDWSIDNGKHWGDMLPPFRQKLNNPAGEEPTASDPNRHTILGGPGTFHTYDAGSDPVVATDSQGRAFFSCVAFDLASNASLVYVVASPSDAQGSFYFNIPTFSRRYIVAEDNNPAVFHDKNWITADAYPGSPNRDNVYVTWTVFKSSPTCGPQPNPDGTAQYCSSPIFGAMSTDHGRTWSTPEQISGTSDALCSFGNQLDPTEPANACNFDQGSNPTVLPNGDLQVIFNNGNTAANNPNQQQLGVHCRPTGSSPAGTAHLNCASPSKVGDDVTVGEPRCDFGRGPEECIPGAYIRTNDFPRITKDNTQSNHLYAVWQDYRNGEYDIQMSQSIDGGLTWHEVGTVNPDRGLDHYMPATDQTPQGNDRNGVSYYRTDRVPNENMTPAAGFGCPPGTTTVAPFTCSGGGTPNSDYVLAGGTAAQTPYAFRVVSPIFPPPDGIQSGFNGDYSGLTINKATNAHPIWSDTRNVNPYPENGVVHDEDIFTESTGLPHGRPESGVGHIGSEQM